MTLLVRLQPVPGPLTEAQQKRKKRRAAADAYAWRLFLRVWRRHRPKSLGVVSSWPVPQNARWVGPGIDPLLLPAVADREEYLAMSL